MALFHQGTPQRDPAHGMPTDGSSPEFAAPKGRGIAFVTGAAGFIGGHVAAAFGRAGWTVAGIGHKGSSPPQQSAIHWFNGTVTPEILHRAATSIGPPEVIVHAAGGSTVGASVIDPARDFERTVTSTISVLSFMRAEAQRARLVFLSSAAVYGSATDGPIAEDAPIMPISPYGLHKKLGEDLVRGWAQLYDLDAVILRLFSVYGPGIRKQLLWEVTQQLLTRPPSIMLFGRGDEIRDFLFVDDVAQMIGCLVEASRAAETLSINAGTGRAVTVREAVTAIRDALGGSTAIRFNGTVRAGDPKSLLADLTLARQLGFEPSVPLQDGVRQYLAWIKSVLAPTGS